MWRRPTIRCRTGSSPIVKRRWRSCIIVFGILFVSMKCIITTLTYQRISWWLTDDVAWHIWVYNDLLCAGTSRITNWHSLRSAIWHWRTLRGKMCVRLDRGGFRIRSCIGPYWFTCYCCVDNERSRTEKAFLRRRCPKQWNVDGAGIESAPNIIPFWSISWKVWIQNLLQTQSWVFRLLNNWWGVHGWRRINECSYEVNC